MLLWLFVVAKNKVPFQVEVEVISPKGYTTFPKYVLITGKISEKFFRREVLECFKAKIDEKGRIKVLSPLPSPFLEIDNIFPKKSFNSTKWR